MNKVEAPIGFVENSNVAPQIQKSSKTNSKQFNDPNFSLYKQFHPVVNLDTSLLLNLAQEEIKEKGYEEYDPGNVRNINDEGILPPTKSNSLKIINIKEIENSYPGWQFVGGGEKYDHCGTQHTKGCDNVAAHGNGKQFISSLPYFCYRKECPRCYVFWASLQAQIIQHRMLCYLLRKKIISTDLLGNVNTYFSYSAINEIYSIPNLILRQKIIESTFQSLRGPKVIHCSLSFSENYYSEDPKKLLKIAVKVAKKCGLRGFIAAFHPYRRIDRKKGYDLGNVVYNPHFHFVGFGWINGKLVSEISKTKGINVYNHGVRKSVYNTLVYEFSHCAIKRGTKTYSYYGHLHHRHLGETPKMPRFNSLCKMCKEKLKKCLWVGETENPILDLIGDFLFTPGSWIFYDIALKCWSGP